MRIDIPSYFGLRKPYNLTYATLFLISIFGIIVVLLSAAAWAMTGHLHVGTPRLHFLIYLLTLFIGAAVLVRATFVSQLLLYLAWIELLLIFASFVGMKTGLPIPYVVPADIRVSSAQPQFVYHPLLMGEPAANYRSSGDLDVRHNSKNMRGGEVTVLPGQKLIATIGNSTTYDQDVPFGSTWPEKLQSYLGPTWVVANFGVPGYSSAEHVVQTAFYYDRAGTPACSIYYMGLNDVRSAHIPNLDAGYANFHILSQANNLDVRAHREISFISPLFHIIGDYLRSGADTIPQAPDYVKLGPVHGSDPGVEAIFRRNMQAIHAINSARGIKTLFVGQMLNAAKLTADAVGNGWYPRLTDKDIWTVNERFKEVMRGEANTLGAAVITLPNSAFTNADFMDRGHFTSQGSDKFARLLSEEVRKECR